MREQCNPGPILGAGHRLPNFPTTLAGQMYRGGKERRRRSSMVNKKEKRKGQKVTVFSVRVHSHSAHCIVQIPGPPFNPG